MESARIPAQLRMNVTRPNGTTQAGLDVLMDEERALPPLMRATVHAAAARPGARPWLTSRFDDFLKVDIRVGRVIRAEPFPEARKPAIKLWIDFGPEIGERKTSAQMTVHYTPEALVGRQRDGRGELSAPPDRQFMSEVLVLGVPDADGAVVLLSPDLDTPLGGRMH